MQNITLAPEVYERVEQIAQARRTTVDFVLTEAVKRYLWEIQSEISSEASQIYRQRHAELKEKYLGQFIAMQNGQVVDADPDLAALRTRVRSRFGLEPILMTRVEQDLEPMIVKRGFTLDWSQG